MVKVKHILYITINKNDKQSKVNCVFYFILYISILVVSKEIYFSDGHGSHCIENVFILSSNIQKRNNFCILGGQI